MWIADNWKDYEIIDCSKGEKLERWGKYLLVRPDPQVIWDTPKTDRGWKNMNGHYHRSKKGGGEWEFFKLPQQWQIHYGSLTFNLKPFYDDRSINGLLAKIKQHLTPKKKRELSVKVCSRFRFYFICILFIFADENFIIKSSTASVYLPSLCNLFLRRIRFFIISECSFADMYR